MELTYCDVCRKQVEDPIPTRTFFRVAEINICESCKEDLESAVKYTVRGKQPFDYGWYDELSMKILREGVQKGKINIKR
jgi:ribosome-binding protein aMBF1 (putative translation factor)